MKKKVEEKKSKKSFTKKISKNKNKSTPEDKKDKEKFEDLYKRALADYQNLLKRSAEEKQDFAKYANEQLLHQIIPVYDNLKTSLQHTDKSLEGSAWVEGVRYVVKQFSTVLNDVGIEEIETIGKKFDHDTMEAVKGTGEKVEKELRAGYKLNNKVIIPAKVELIEE
jgi:molecular chaperone GrpE